MKMRKSTFVVIMSFLAFNACNSLTKSNSKRTAKTQLSLTTSPNGNTNAMTTSSSPNPGSPSTSSVIVANANDTLKIDTAKVMIREIEFHGSEKMENQGDSLGHSDSLGNEEHYHHHYANEDSTEFEAGPYILNLNLDTTLTTIAINQLPNGTYNAISFKIHRPLPNASVQDSDFVDGPGIRQRYSIVVKGYFNGKHFVFKTPETIREHIFLNPPLTISDSLNSYNATINVDVSKWFIGRDGNIIDPTDPHSKFAISWAIHRSFRAFKDNNEDGHEDHDEWGMNHDQNNNDNHQGNENDGNS